MATQQDTLLFIGESMLVQKFHDTKWTEQGCKKAMFQGEPSASEAKRRSQLSVSVSVYSMLFRSRTSLLLERISILRKLLLCILLRYTGTTSCVSSNNLTEAAPSREATEIAEVDEWE
jgi:hypothetical protein